MLTNYTEAVSFLIGKAAWVEESDGNDETALHVAGWWTLRRGALCRR